MEDMILFWNQQVTLAARELSSELAEIMSNT